MPNKIVISEKGRFIAQDFAKWVENQKVFLAPLGMFYIVFVTAQVNADGLVVNDFIPNNAVISAMVLYVLNAAYDFLRKLAGEKKYTVGNKLP